MPAEEKQYPIAVQETASGEFSNESDMNINKSPANTSKLVGLDSDRLTGIKRQQPDSPASPSSCQIPVKSVSNGNLVYARRKLENEHSMSIACMMGNAAPLSQTEIKVFNMHLGQKQERNTACFSEYVPTTLVPLAISSAEPSVPCTIGKPYYVSAKPEPYGSAAFETSATGDPNEVSRHDYKDRFFQLQLFLRSCDQSSQEEYMKMLRSLSAVGRSSHAVQLEKRAINLLVEEGKELQRMRFLNVLGKPSPTHPPIPSQASCLPTRLQK